ncbi:GORDITA [Arabidopsis thaliana]|uniref:Isoform 2 of Agamous-like MADS-box protein AGL63 n=1 Tax=Arabidopsis thaliana TaxID=3702 RepID=Q9SA07-2|nr:GORDITA [Arabidopsis thaliana]AAN52807.1 MADS-box protein AGL63 [Arabidopsis thaliana]AEE31316.1 GORDITA [Arabidopsis thaliana]|eukprot:NP_174399.2 GORDITA [Arabidopsis thaliana]
MRKGKRVIKKIEEKIKRQVTFAKRKKSLIKKAYELSVLCDVHLGLIIFSHSNRLYDFCSNSTSMENLIMRYQKEKEGQTTAEHSFHSCSDCVKTKESMMREIENLKLNLQLYDGHGLNLLTYDELLSFELHLESSLQHARARKSEFMHQQQQQQTDQKLKGKEKGQGSSWEQLMWQAERQMMTCQRQKDPAPANEGGVPFLRWGTTHRRSSPP